MNIIIASTWEGADDLGFSRNTFQISGFKTDLSNEVIKKKVNKNHRNSSFDPIL